MKSSDSIPRRSTDVTGEECVGILLRCGALAPLQGGTAGYDTCPCRRTGVFLLQRQVLQSRYPGGMISPDTFSFVSKEEQR